MSEIEIARVPSPPCRCGSTSWEGLGEGDTQCTDCGAIYTSTVEVERIPNADGVIERVQAHVHRPLDDADDRHVLIRINTGRDDQRPDPDPDRGIFRPLCVARHLSPKEPGDSDSDGIHTYLKYCGHCRHKWGSLGESGDWVYCPYCASRIGNYVFADGVEHWRPPRRWAMFEEDGHPPEVWPSLDVCPGRDP